MPLIANSAEGLIALRDILRSELAAAAYDPAYGAMFVVTENDADNADGLTRIVLIISSDASEPSWGHTARKCSIDATVYASDYALKAIVPDGQPIDTKLVTFLQGTASNYDLFNEAGLWGIEFDGTRQARSTGANSPGIINTCRFTFYYDPRG